MYKQVFDYNGNVYLVKADKDGELLIEDLKKQGLYQYTEIMPPSKLFPPRRFDGETWYGASPDSDDNIEEIPEQIQVIMAETQMQVTKTAVQTKKAQQEQAEVALELAKKDQRIQKLEEQVAQAMLEVAKLKGE